MNDLVRRAQSHVQETGNGDGRDEVAVGEGVAGVVNALQGVARQVQVLLRSDNVDILTVVDHLANEGHILQSEKGELALLNACRAAKDVLSLPVEGTLTEDGSDEAALI